MNDQELNGREKSISDLQTAMFAVRDVLDRVDPADGERATEAHDSIDSALDSLDSALRTLRADQGEYNDEDAVITDVTFDGSTITIEGKDDNA